MKRFSMALFLFTVFSFGGMHSAFPSAPPIKEWLVDLDNGSGNVEFRATGHPSSLRIVGKGAAPKGKFTVAGNQAQGTISFDLNSLDTGIEMRTHHMKEKYLETGKYQQATLTVSHLTLPEDIAISHFSAENIPFTGTLLLHGVQKPVSGTAKIEKTGDKVILSAQFGLKVSDYGIVIPSFAGITMADEVQVTVADSAPVVAMTRPEKAKKHAL
jgi:polyisoprenoid-binding protein YceI